MRLFYKLSPEPLSWDEGRKYCESIDGDLIVLGARTLKMRRSVGHILLRQSTFWVGASYDEATSTWTWVDGTTDDEHPMRWASRQPAEDKEKKCVGVFNVFGFRAFNSDCDYKHYAVCEVLQSLPAPRKYWHRDENTIKYIRGPKIVVYD